MRARSQDTGDRSPIPKQGSALISWSWLESPPASEKWNWQQTSREKRSDPSQKGRQAASQQRLLRAGFYPGGVSETSSVVGRELFFRRPTLKAHRALDPPPPSLTKIPHRGNQLKHENSPRGHLDITQSRT